MLRIIDVVETVADANITVLLTGQSGTGKSLIARAIHGSSTRRNKPFVEVSCGALSESLLESELFGHVRGSFTGALADKPGKFKAAHGGTIFLDEIASASPALQVKLLRVLQDRRFEPLGSNLTEAVDVRVILATNVDLQEAVDAGRFRKDLYYRINVVNIEAPRLVDRKTDIPLLARHFLDEHGSHGGGNRSNISSETMRILQGYDWPGNVRELENVIARALVFAKGPTIDPHDLPPHILDTVKIRDQNEGFRCQSLCQALAEPEKQIIESALAANNWSRKATADELRIDRTTLYKKMKRHGLQGEPVVRR
jgi:transcriptional regulator with PAS, ATPase and Fis domain